jgi:hypothetical protein
MEQNMLRLTFLLISLITVGCTTFPTSYARIEDDKVRLLDFIYEPAEASPGDTVKLRAVFSGKKVSATDIEWCVSTNVFKNVYGVDTAFDIKPLTVPLYQDSFSENTSCVSFAFVIPHDIFTKSSMIPDDWTTIIPKEFRKSIPEDVAGLSKAQLLSVVEIASSMVDAAEENPLDSTYDQYKEMIPGILQALVVPVRFFARVKGSHRIQSDYSVSFNRRFGKLPGIYPNKNPVIDSLGIYKVNGENLALYNPASKKHTFYRLDIASDSVPVIRVERGYSYFVAAFTSGRDTAVTLDTPGWWGPSTRRR